MRKKISLLNVLLIVGSICFGGNIQAAGKITSNEKTGISQQKRRVTGVVEDALGPVAGASIALKGTTQGTISDMDGEFTMDVADGQTLVVSFLGYVTQEIKVQGQTSLTIRLAEDTKLLDEVVVTALGMKRDQKALGYAVTELKAEELNTNLINPVSALQGKVAGVEISSSDGGMFGSTKILIRGVSTLGKNNQPIYVVDGIILDNSVKEGNPDWDSQTSDYGNELKNLNPDDFESITVLKGAAATSLYGSRGLNGAVVITTKSGRAESGLGINVSQTFGVDALTSSPDLQNVYGNGTVAGYVAYGDKDSNGNYYIYDTFRQFPTNSDGRPSLIMDEGFAYGPAFDGREIEYYDGLYRSYKPVKNNFKDAHQKGFNSNTHVAISGGNDKTTFYTSMSYKYNSGILPGNEFQRLSFLGKASHKITDRVKIEASMAFSNSHPKNSERNVGENFVNGTWNRSYDAAHGKKKYKGTHGGLASSAYGDEWGNMPGSDVWWDIYENDRGQKETSVRPTVKLEIDLLDWLKFNAEGNYNHHYIRYEAKERGDGYANEGGRYEMSISAREQTNFNANFIASKTFGDWSFNGFLRGEYFENFRQFQKMETAGGLIVPNQFFIENSKQTPKYESKISGTKKILSVAFQAGVSWKNQLFVDVTGRNDWSSSLVYSDGHGNYSYFYPSVSGSWLLTNTFRDQLPEWISFGKIRGSWAQVGNDTSPYLINSAYELNTSTTNSGSYYGLKVPTSTYDNNLKPERKNAWEVGLDWRFVDHRFGIDFTFYKENTKDQIMSISVPYESGINDQLINAGNIQNMGVELAVNMVPVRTKDFEWGLDLTWTKNENKIISLHENVADYIELEGSPAYGNYRMGSVAKVGAKYGTIMSDSYLKIDKSSGLPMLVWTDSQRRSHYLRNEEEVVELGSIVPDFLGSVSTSLKYKNWSLNIGLNMRFGGYVASYNSRYGTAYGFTKNSLKGAPGHGGITWTSKYDGMTYHDGVIPEGVIPSGTAIKQPDGTAYTVGSGGVSTEGESYQELLDKGVVEPTHSSAWTYRNHAWTMAGRNYGVVTDSWFKKLNYISLQDVSLGYRMPANICQKLKAKNLVFTLAGHNLGYLLNTMPSGENPQSVSGTSAGEFRVRSFRGVTSSFTFTVNASF